MRIVTAALLSLAVLACTETPTDPELSIDGLRPNFAKAGIGISGVGTNRQGATLRVEAVLTPAGGAGFLYREQPTSLSGPVIEVVPPSTAHPHWCIIANRLGPPLDPDAIQTVIVWIRDIGDGISTFDLFFFGAGGSCTREPDPPFFSPLIAGDYKERL